ncbi:MAG: hypothetical protein IJH71_09675 [Eubacterium sp.]|nr:hypothetical protein [Eubacterium sp.]
MRISEKIVVGEKVNKHANEILKALAGNRPVKKGGWYAVTTAPTAGGQMYILPSYEVFKDYYREHDVKVLGIAGSRKEACRIVEKLVLACDETGQIGRLKEYLADF